MPNYNEFLNALDNSAFETMPVDLDEFLYGKDYLNLLPIKVSPIQRDIIERSSQILLEPELIQIHGKEKGSKIWESTTRDVFLALGKSSGKDFSAQVICCRIVYLLLCLKDPAAYFNRPKDAQTTIANVAQNAKAANEVFFRGFIARVKNCKFFDGKYHIRSSDINFDKSIDVVSSNSETGSIEGYDLLVVIADEIDHGDAEKAEEMYNSASATVTSRFPTTGKMIVLSFPRSRRGFLMKKYNEAVLDKDVEEHSHTFKLNSSLEDGEPGNEFTIKWTEDKILGYKYDNFWALKAPTWVVREDKSIEDFKMQFYASPEDSLTRFAADPPDADSNAFFKNHEKLDSAFKNENGYNLDIRIKPEEDKTYYIHIDLSSIHDMTVVAMGHVSHWQEISMGTIKTEPAPYIVIDLFRVWEPTRDNPVNHQEVMQFILELCKKFKVELVTFDQWGSFNMIEYLTSVGIKAEKKSLGRPEYQEFALAVGDERIEGPYDERFLDELKNLVILPSGKVDHPKKHHNDISEAVCGVIRNCVQNESEDSNLKVVSLSTIRRDNNLTQAKQHAKVQGQMPGELSDWIRQLDALNSKSKPND